MFIPLKQTSQSRFNRFDHLAAIEGANLVARWANRSLILFILLFALSVPHSIAASQISFGLGVIFWIVRDLASRRFHFARTPLDWPLLAFASLTVLSSVFSVEPSLSLAKLKALTLFAVIYLLATNLHRRGVVLVIGLLIVSALAGVGFSFAEKVYGRGMIITAIEDDSPLKSSDLRPGDVIWMIARKRVYSPDDAAAVIRNRNPGDVLDVEALHAGDPVPVTLTVTEELKAKQNPLGVETSGRSRQFRVSGFSRQFLTYAEQMQILGMLAFGGLLTGIRLWRKRSARMRLAIFSLLFILFALALILTASRAVIAAFIIALLCVSISFGGRLAPVMALTAAILLGGVGYYVISAARQPVTLSFNDDSASRRIAYMRAGMRVIPQHPLLGVGMDSHKRHWREWGFPGDYITHTHSTPIQIAMDRGLPALAGYFWLIVAMMMMAWRGYRRARDEGDDFGESLMLGSLGALIGFTLSSLTNYNFGDSETLMMLLCVTGVGAAESRLSRTK
ncbi:MAG: O-antigen ligase family protein [Blastocatellales bacterium]